MKMHAPLRPSPHRNRAITALAMASLAIASRVSATTGDVEFKVDAAVAHILVSCNGGPFMPLADVDPVSAETTGDNVATIGTATASACVSILNPAGIEIYRLRSATDEAIATFTSIEDSGEARSDVTDLRILGGLIAMDRKIEDDKCVETDSVACVGHTDIQGLSFAGQPIVGHFTEKTEFPVVGLQIPAAACVPFGLGLVTGKLTLGSREVSPDGLLVKFVPLAFDGSFSCVGWGTGTMAVHFEDSAYLRLKVTATYLGYPISSQDVDAH